jgi:ribose transport system permease protein
VAAAIPERPPSRTRTLDLALRLLGAGPVVILAVLCIAITAARPVFLSTLNLQNVLLQSSVVGILAIGSLVVILAGHISGGSATVGQAAGGLLDAIAAVIIGGASIQGGRGTVWNCIVGTLLIGVIRNGLALMGASPFLQGLLVGGTILVAVQLDVVRTVVERRIRTIQSNVGEL